MASSRRCQSQCIRILTMAFGYEIPTVSVAWEQAWGFRINEIRTGLGYFNVIQRMHVGFFNGVFPWRRHCHMQRISSYYKKNCVLREELRVMHDKVHPLDQTKKMVKIMFIGWCLLCTALVLLLTMTMI